MSSYYNEYFNNPELKGETKEYLKNFIKNKIIRRVEWGMKKDAQTAKKMEVFLNALKEQNYKKEFSTLNRLINNTALEELKSNLPNIFTEIYTPEAVKNQLYDDVFERDLNMVLQKITGISENFYAGQESANTIKEKDIVNKILININKSLEETTINQIKETTKLTDLFTVPEARAQKVDISTAKIKITQSINPEYANIINLFKEYNFSLKNYSFSKNDYGFRVTLGDTNPLKAFIGTLTSFNISEKMAIKTFFAATSAYARDSDRELADYIFSIRYYYELMGAGLRVDGDLINQVDFLIINNPNGRVMVRSTKELIYNLLKEENKNYRQNWNPFREIHTYVKI